MRKFLIAVTLLAGCITSDPASTRLENTPRHDEWAQIARGDRTLHAYVSYPERSTKAPAVVVIHENRGLTDWVRSVADQLSERGYIAIAPDMLSGMAPGGGKTSDFPSQDAAREGISRLPREQVLGDLQAAADYVKALPAASGKLFVAGFCWGGARTWDFANARRDLSASFVFYGTGPQAPEGVANINAPVFGFYGGADERVNATIPKSEELMRVAGKRFEPVIYPGAGHGFMRSGEAADASAENKSAREESWKRWAALLAEN